MPRIYSVIHTGTLTASGGDSDLFSFQPADDKPLMLRGFRLGQVSETGDLAEEMLRLTLRRMTATVTIGSGGSSLTAIPPLRNSAEPVWGFTARANDTTVATTTGNNVIHEEIGWNIRNTPFEVWYPDEDFALMVRQTEALILRNETVVADDITICLTAWIQEA